MRWITAGPPPLIRSSYGASFLPSLAPSLPHLSFLRPLFWFVCGNEFPSEYPKKITEVTRPWENMVNVLYVMNGSMVKFITADRANYEVIKHLSERAALSRPGTSLQ